MKTPEQLDRWILMSILLHLGLAAAILSAPGLFPAGGTENWGATSAGEGMNVNIVGNLPGMALPAPDNTKENAAVNDSKGLYKSEPEPTPPPQPEEKAEPIPDKTAKVPKKPKAVDKPAAKSTPPAPETPENAVPFGKGGQPNVGYGNLTTGTGPAGIGGFGDAAFGSKYADYVDAMKRKISQNWLKGLVDSTQIRGATPPRVYMSFDIERDGKISNIEMKQSSNYPTLDNSAKRALFASNPLPALPRDYAGSKVSVTFYFEYVK